MSFELKPATRQGFKPLIGLFSKSGGGKTFSALLLARGFVGPQGKIVLIDTETGRGSQYAPQAGEAPLPMGAYEVVEMDAPFAPARYVEAMDFVEEKGAHIGIIDSLSHCWEGIGGVLDMAMENEAAKGKSLNNWNKPKLEFAKLVLKMQRSRIPWIVCLRAKEKTHQGKDDKGKTVIQKDDFLSPITEKDFIFELSAYGELTQANTFIPLKNMHPTLRACFPRDKMLEVAHGAALAQWCATPGKSSKPTTATDPKKALLIELRDITSTLHGWKKEHGADGWIVAKKALQMWLTDELGQQVILDAQSPEELAETVAAVKRKLAEGVPA